MLSICSDSHRPFINLAIEEYLLQKRNEDFLLLYINDPCVVIGKHQVAHREVNTKFTEQNAIPVIRRISGGGTVYQDRGNLNFSFIKQSETGEQVNFRLYTQPVIDFLLAAGVNVVFSGKNDLSVDGLKISGNAEHVYRERVLHHGTLLFDASLGDLRQSLREKTDCYSTRAVDSNRTSVTNLKGKLNGINTTEAFMKSILDYLVANIPDNKIISLGESEMNEIGKLSAEKYETWEWNYAYGPPYNFKTWFDLNGKVHTCRMAVKDGIIWECELGGGDEFKSASKRLIGCRHMSGDLQAFFKREDLPLTEDEVYKFF